MAKEKDHMIFRKGDRVYCRKDFPFSGRPFKAGDIFPWRRMSVSHQKVNAMFHARFLTHTAPPKKKGGESIDGKFTYRHRGGGWYDVLLNGTKVNPEPLQGKKNAKKWAAEYQAG